LGTRNFKAGNLDLLDVNQMKWILLIGDENFSLDIIKAINHKDCIRCCDVDENRFLVDFGTDHIFYDYDVTQTTLMEYEKDELEKIPFKNPRIIIMTYTSEERLKDILKQNDFPKGIYVDNDFGLIVPLEEFIKLGIPLE